MWKDGGTHMTRRTTTPPPPAGAAYCNNANLKELYDASLLGIWHVGQLSPPAGAAYRSNANLKELYDASLLGSRCPMRFSKIVQYPCCPTLSHVFPRCPTLSHVVQCFPMLSYVVLCCPMCNCCPIWVGGFRWCSPTKVGFHAGWNFVTITKVELAPEKRM